MYKSCVVFWHGRVNPVYARGEVESGANTKEVSRTCNSKQNWVLVRRTGRRTFTFWWFIFRTHLAVRFRQTGYYKCDPVQSRRKRENNAFELGHTLLYFFTFFSFSIMFLQHILDGRHCPRHNSCVDLFRYDWCDHSVAGQVSKKDTILFEKWVRDELVWRGFNRRVSHLFGLTIMHFVRIRTHAVISGNENSSMRL